METQEYPKILFPYDFSPESNHAMQYLAGLSKIFNYSVEILNIIDPGTKNFIKDNNLSKLQLEEKVAELARGFQDKHNISTSHLIKNVPIKRIRKISEKEKVSFTFLAINEPAKMASKIMKVVTTSPVPAFVVQNGVEYKPYKKILFRLDDASISRQKAGWTLRFAKRTNATVHIFSINPALLGDKEKAAKHRKVIDTVERFFEKNQIDYVTEISKVSLVDFDNDIMVYSKKTGIDLITIMIPVTFWSPINPYVFKLIFNPEKIPVLCVNQRDLYLGGGIS
jgi:nucleotide-binding universal stress UspA family protein